MANVTDGLRVTGSVVVPPDELRFRFSRSGGPGGQNVNTRDTRVELVFDVSSSSALGPRQRARVLERLGSRLDSEGRLRIVAADERSQGRNRELALERLGSILAEALHPDPPVRRATRPSKGADEARLAAKRVRSRLKQGRAAVPED